MFIDFIRTKVIHRLIQQVEPRRTNAVQTGALYLSPILRFMRPTWGPSGADRAEVGPMLAPLTLISGM